MKRVFTKTTAHRYQVSNLVREALTFAPQNLISDSSVSRLDLVSCRNLLIYQDPQVPQKLIVLFHFALKEGDHLFVGASESVGQQSRLFETVSKKWSLFRRLASARRELPEPDRALGSLRGARSGDHIDGVVITFFDISMRTRAERRLRESEAALRTPTWL